MTQHQPKETPRLILLLMATLLTPAAVAWASAEHCTVRYSDEIEHLSPTGATFIAVPEFQLNCRGGIHGSLNVMDGRMANTQLQIEQKTDGQWTVVERGHTLVHQAEPGAYRLTVAQTEKTGNFSRWKLRYSKPLS